MCGIFCPMQCQTGDPGAVTLWWEVKAPLWVGAPLGQQEAPQCSSRLSDSQWGRQGLPGNGTLSAAPCSELGLPGLRGDSMSSPIRSRGRAARMQKSTGTCWQPRTSACGKR